MAKRSSGLGRGLDAIFLDNSDLNVEESVAKAIEIISSKVDLGELR